MSEKRRAEIEAKRAKLAELRKARADRQRAETERRQAEAGSTSNAARRDVDELVNALVGNRGLDSGGDITPSSSMPGTPPRQSTLFYGTSTLSPSGRVSRQSDAGSDKNSLGTTMIGTANSGTDHVIERTLTPRFVPDLIDVEQELFELPQRERVIYNKEVQTTAVEVEAPEVSVEDIRQQIQRERELEAERVAREKELEEESIQLDQEIEQEIRELSEEERTSIVTAPEFLDFVEQSSKIVQRALNDGYDYIRDYTVGTEANGQVRSCKTFSDDSEGKRVKRVCAFYDERYGKNRSITDVDWSPKYPELSVASYNKNPAALNEPDGIVAVWNLHLLERPEFVFHSQSDVLSVTCSPFHSNLVFGGTYSGQILLWDTRSKHLPVLKTPLSAAGHTHPVYAMRMVGTQNAHNLITSSTDGTVCSWLVDMLAQPQETLELIHAGHNKTGEVAITTLDFPDNETTTFWVGTEEGNVYQANRYDRAGAKAGLNQYDIYKGHAGPVMGLHFHPLVGPVDFSDLFLTASVDWTVKLWRAKSLAKPSTAAHAIPPIYSFDEADDYVYDVKWHPAHPALFGTADGSGKFELWNLNTDTEVPAVSTSVASGRAINKLQWDRKDGRRVALGCSDGKLYIYDIGDMAIPRESEWTDLQKTIAGMVGSGQANGVVEGDATRIVAGR
ncbi:WD40-repeat-containing domain protein [Scleroderma citrinum]